MFDAQLLAARVTVDEKQRVHARDHVDRGGILRIHLDRVDKFAPRVRPATYVHHLWPTDIVIGLIAVGLQNPSQWGENLPGPRPPASESKHEQGFPAGRAVL